jgi:hypothetical protein
VTVKNGWVTLEGTVDWQFQKDLADSAAQKLKGVKGIINDIEVKPKVSPTEVKSKIEEALRRSAELDARRITVEVEGSAPALATNLGGNHPRREWAEPSGGFVGGGRERCPLFLHGSAGSHPGPFRKRDSS